MTNADAVLTVLLDNDRVRQIDEPIHPQTERGIPPVAMSFSVYEFKVLASVKGGPRTGDRIRIARYGRRGDYEPDFPRPGVGEQFLVFLKWSRRLDAFEHLYGRVAFRIVSGDVQSMDYRLRRASGQRLDDVLAVLRRSLPGAEGPRR